MIWTWDNDTIIPCLKMKGINKMNTNNTLDKMVNDAKIIALYDLKKKINEEIEALEEKNGEIGKQPELPF